MKAKRIITAVLATTLALTSFAGDAMATSAGIDLDFGKILSGSEVTPESTGQATDQTTAAPQDNFADQTTAAESAEAQQPQTQQAGTGDFADADFVMDDSMKIAEGVYVGSINLGGMNPTEAGEALSSFNGELFKSETKLVAGEKTYTTTLENMGFSSDPETAVEQAVSVGRFGLLIERYKKITDLKFESFVINIPVTVDEAKYLDYINTNIAVNDTKGSNASISRASGNFVITPEVTGIITDAEATKQVILTTLAGGVTPGLTIQVSTKVDTPSITSAMLSTITDRLSSYSTKYGSSTSGRKTNIKIASNNIGGTILLPGESMSASSKMKQRTKENGYQLATEYNSGESVEAYGGGVCQVATTLYQAVLRAELQIDERHNHSMMVSYVDPSYDAAIAWGDKDFQFTNNTQNPIYISASADGETLTFTIYGKEYRPSNRSISFESVVLERVKSETIVKEDPKLPKGEQTVKGSNHDKCRSYLVKKVYVDGKLTDTIKYRQDSYQASHKVITKGTMEPTIAPPVNPTAPIAPTNPQPTQPTQPTNPTETLPEQPTEPTNPA